MIHLLSDAGKLFTSGLIMFSLGSLAWIGSSLARFIFDGELKDYLKTYRVDKKIMKLRNHTIIIGYGRNGEQAAMELPKLKYSPTLLNFKDICLFLPSF